MTCQTSAVPLTVRAEGVTERLGEVVLNCSGGTPGSALTGNLTVTLPFPITNRVDVNNVPLGAQLAVDTGAGLLPSGTATLSGPQTAGFTGVSFTIPASRSVLMRISGLRGNVSQTPNAPAAALLAVTGFSGLTLTNNLLTVATPQPAFLATYSSNGVRCGPSPAPESLTVASLLAARTASFSVRATEGLTNALMPGQTGEDNGVRLIVRYSGFPAGVRIYVPEVIAGSNALQPTSAGDFGQAAAAGAYAPGSGALALVRVLNTDANGAGGTPAAGPGAYAPGPVREVPLASGDGFAVFEVVDGNPGVRESVQIPSFYSLAALQAPAIAQQTLHVGPVSAAAAATRTDPVPRFLAAALSTDCAVAGDCRAPYFPRLVVDAPAMEFTAPSGSPQTAALTRFLPVRNEGGGAMNWSAAVRYESGAGWLRLSPSSGFNNGTVRADVDPSTLPAGTYRAAISIDAGPLTGTSTIPVVLNVTARPAVTVSAVVNAASWQAVALVPGSVATLSGSRFSGASVTFDGIPARVLFGNDTQINLQVPAELAGRTSARMVVSSDGAAAATQEVRLAAAAPGVFNPGILNQDFSVNSAQNPAASGSIVQVYATGLPAAGGFGRVSDQDILSPEYAGPAPGIAGLQQVNLRLPAGLTGQADLAVCAFDGAQRVCSPAVRIYVR